MNYNIVIKIKVDGDFIENNSYELLLDYNKISNIISSKDNYKECDNILRSFDKKIIDMKYIGISRTDLKKIFVIDVSYVNRELILKEIGL